jgi:predicted metal-dependent hydrolase
MSETLQLGDISIQLIRKAVKHVHLSVHPPEGRVSLVAPTSTRVEAARAYAISKLAWIRTQRARFSEQARESPRRFITRESHFLWGRRYLLSVEHRGAKPGVRLDHRRVTLIVHHGSTQAVRAKVMHEWHKSLLHEVVPRLIAKWESRLGLQVAGYFLQRMKTKWGGCNHKARHIRLNTELVKKPKALLEYVIVHEMIHLIEPRHSERFMSLLARHYPTWREARLELNELPLAAAVWGWEKRTG